MSSVKSWIFIVFCQPAQPSTLGHYLSAAIEVMLRDHQRLMQARELLDLCPLGAAAITTSGFPLDRHRTAHLLGFKAPLQNSYGCIAAVDYATSVFSAVELVFLHLGRLIQDRDLRGQLGEGARQTAVARRWDAIHDQLLDDYNEAIAGQRAARAAA